MKLFDMSGKTALVTGSSRGIGRAIAQAYAQAGARVIISSRKTQACETVAAHINDTYGEGRAVAIPANISDQSALEHLVAETRRQLGAIDILVCNAASNPHFGPLTGISDDQFRKIFDNNVLSSIRLAGMIAPEMAERGGGAIILISSIGGLIGSPTIGAYNMSKAADMQLVRNLAVDLGDGKIRVNAIAPGVIRTDFARALWEDPVAEADFCSRTPLGRIGEPDDIAGAAVFLGSDAGCYVTGQTIIVDGGITIENGL